MALAIGGSVLSCDRNHLPDPAEGWRIGTSSHSIRSAGDQRTFLVHVPKGRWRTRFRRAAGFPLVILLHGSGADGETIRKQSNFDSIADRFKVVAVYPDAETGPFGFGADWNAGECCGASAQRDVDDMAFLNGIIAEVGRHLPIQRGRIYVAGFSDGGRMAFHFACGAAPTVAAIGVVSGSLVDAHCSPARPVPVIMIHGTSDDQVPYNSKALTLPPAPAARELAGVPPATRFWAVENGCSGLITKVIAPTVLQSFFRKCVGAPVSLFTLKGGTHSWPGGRKDGSQGETPLPALDASAVLMRFFLSHTR